MKMRTVFLRKADQTAFLRQGLLFLSKSIDEL